MYWDAIPVIDKTDLVENFHRYVRKRVEESGSTWRGLHSEEAFTGKRIVKKCCRETLSMES